MHYLELALVVGVVGLMVLTTVPRVRHARRRGRARRARRYWAAYDYAWGIVYGGRRLKRLPYLKVEEPAE